MYIKAKGKEIKKDRLHYCDEKSGVKKVCYSYNNKDCIEIKIKEINNFYKEKIELMKKSKKSLYALDIFEGEGLSNNNIGNDSKHDIFYTLRAQFICKSVMIN